MYHDSMDEAIVLTRRDVANSKILRIAAVAHMSVIVVSYSVPALDVVAVVVADAMMTRDVTVANLRCQRLEVVRGDQPVTKHGTNECRRSASCQSMVRISSD